MQSIEISNKVIYQQRHNSCNPYSDNTPYSQKFLRIEIFDSKKSYCSVRLEYDLLH